MTAVTSHGVEETRSLYGHTSASKLIQQKPGGDLHQPGSSHIDELLLGLDEDPGVSRETHWKVRGRLRR